MPGPQRPLITGWGLKVRSLRTDTCRICSVYVRMMTSLLNTQGIMLTNNCDADTWKTKSKSVNGLFTVIFITGRMRTCLFHTCKCMRIFIPLSVKGPEVCLSRSLTRRPIDFWDVKHNFKNQRPYLWSNIPQHMYFKLSRFQDKYFKIMYNLVTRVL